MAGSLLSGIVTITTAGTAVAGPTTLAGTIFAIKAHPDNTDTVWVGNDGGDDVAATNGFPLNPGEGVMIDLSSLEARNLGQIYFDADVNGEKACWIKVY